jgi:hypothetical protein
MKAYQLLKKLLNCNLKPVAPNQNQEVIKMKPSALFRIPLTFNFKPLTLISERRFKMLRKLVFSAVIFVILAQISFAGVSHKVEFFSEDLSFRKEKNYDIVEIKDCFFAREDTGRPMLPVKIINLIIPIRNTVKKVDFLSVESETLSGTYNICPTQPDYPTGSPPPPWVEPNPATYSQTTPYPGKFAEVVHEGYFQGNKIVMLELYPLQWIPATGKLLFYKNIELKLELSASSEEVLYPQRISESGYRLYKSGLESLVENKGDIKAYGHEPEIVHTLSPPDSYILPAVPGPASFADYLIITRDAWASAFYPLVEWLFKKGWWPVIITVESILQNYSGVDDAEKVRNCIKAWYGEHGTQWVLLGGDDKSTPGASDDVPFRYGWQYNNDNDPEYVIPTDFYFSCLDDNSGGGIRPWDKDGDGRWGEPQDNPDLIPDVWVGRVLPRAPQEVSNWITKTLNYEQNPGNRDHVKDVIWCYDNDHKSTVDVSINHWNDLTTGFTHHRCQHLTSLATIDCLNSSSYAYGWVCIYAHGTFHAWRPQGKAPDNYEYVSSAPGYGCGNLSQLTLWNRYFLVYDIACNNAEFDKKGGWLLQDTTIADGFIDAHKYIGAAAFLGNTRYGYFDSSPELQRKFLDVIFDTNPGPNPEYATRLGYAEAASKNLISNNGNDRFVKYSHNLFGSPETPAWTDVPKELDVSHPYRVFTGSNNITVLVKSGGLNVEDARVCLWEPYEEVYEVGSTDASGLVTFYGVNLTAFPMGIYVTVTKQNYIPYQGLIGVVSEDDVITDQGIPVSGVSNIWALTTGLDCKIYGGTSGGEVGSHLFVYDPAKDALTDLGTSGFETFTLTTGKNGLIYGGTIEAPGSGSDAHLFVYNPNAIWSPGYNPADIIDLAPDVANPSQAIVHDLATGSNGDIYIALGYESYSGTDCARILIYHPDGGPLSITSPPTDQIAICRLTLGHDDQVYAGSKAVSGQAGHLYNYTSGVPIDLGTVEDENVIGALTTGVDGAIYGATEPNGWFFKYIPGSPPGSIVIFGQPTETAIRQLITGKDGKIYGGDYLGRLFIYNPNNPSWSPGSNPGDNPRIFAPAVPGENRIRALTTGVNGFIHGGTASHAHLFTYIPSGAGKGDPNGDGEIDVSDVVYLINYLFVGGPAPVPLEAGDANSDGVVDVSDVVYLINYLFAGGPHPSAPVSPGSGLELYKGKTPAQIGFSSPTISKDGIFNLPVIGKFDVDLAAVQLEIKYDPAKITLLEPALTPKTEGLSIYFSSNGSRNLQIALTQAKACGYKSIRKIDSLHSLQVGILDPTGKHQISAGTNALVNLKIKGSDLTSLEITRAILVDKNAQKIPVQIVAKMKESEEELGGEKSAIPQEFSLSQNYPNPFNPETEISYALPRDCYVKLAIYNIAGQKVNTLVDEHQSAGYKTIYWNGRDDQGKKIASGIYFYKLQAGDFCQSKKMMLIK